MADINLLPEEFRLKEKKERAQSGKNSKVIKVTLTSPEKTANVTGKGFWHKLFGGFGKKAAIPFDDRQKAVVQPATKIKPPVSQPFKKDYVSLIQQKPHSEHKPVVKITEHKKYKKQSKAVFDKVIKERVSEKKKELPHKESVPKSDKEKPTEHIKVAKSKIGALHTIDAEEKVTEPKTLSDIMRKIVHKIVRKKPLTSVIEVDLMPEPTLSLREVDWYRVLHTLFVSIGVATGITIIGYLILFNKTQEQEKNFSDLQLAIGKLRVEISALSDEFDEALLLHKKLILADMLITNHVYWTRFFDLLEEYTLDGVYYEGFSGQARAKEIVLTGTARDLSTIFWQREILNDADELAFRATIDNMNINVITGEVNFSLRLLTVSSAWKK